MEGVGALRPPHPPPTQLGIDLCSTQPVQPHMVVCACHVPSHAHCATGHFGPVPIALPLGPSAPGFPLTWAWVWTPPSGHLERRDVQDTGSALGLVPLCPEDWTLPPSQSPQCLLQEHPRSQFTGLQTPHPLSCSRGHAQPSYSPVLASQQGGSLPQFPPWTLPPLLSLGLQSPGPGSQCYDPKPPVCLPLEA